MPRKYTPDQKTAALVLLERNFRDFSLTSRQTAISKSTLYDWDSAIQAVFQETTPRVRQPAELPGFENDLDALAFIRQHIMDEMVRLSSSLQYDSGFSTPYQRVLVLSQLMDKLMKLDQHLQPYTAEEIQYVLSDDVEEEPDEYNPEFDDEY